MSRFLKRFWIPILFVIVNLAVAATPAAARWDSDVCTDDDGDIVECCSWCFLFCECDLLET